MCQVSVPSVAQGRDERLHSHFDLCGVLNDPLFSDSQGCHIPRKTLERQR